MRRHVQQLVVIDEQPSRAGALQPEAHVARLGEEDGPPPGCAERQRLAVKLTVVNASSILLAARVAVVALAVVEEVQSEVERGKHQPLVQASSVSPAELGRAL